MTSLNALKADWLAEGLSSAQLDVTLVDVSKMTSSLRAVLEAVKAKQTAHQSVISPAHTISFKDSAVQVRAMLTKLDGAPVMYKELLARPGYKEAVKDFINKSNVILSAGAEKATAAPPTPIVTRLRPGSSAGPSAAAAPSPINTSVPFLGSSTSAGIVSPASTKPVTPVAPLNRSVIGSGGGSAIRTPLSAISAAAPTATASYSLSINSSGLAVLPPSFVLLSSSGSAKGAATIAPSSKRLRDYRVHMPLDESGNLLRCVDADMKRLTVQRIETDDVDELALERTVSRLSSSTHPFAMQVSSYWRESEAVYLEMPFYPHCTFREWLYKSGKLPNPEALQLAFSQILLGIVYLHDIGLVHGRLDLDAILMGLDFDGKEQLFPIICCLAFKPAWDQKDPAKKPKKTADPTPAKDVYALGQLMHEVFIGGKFAHAADGSLDVSQIKSGDKLLLSALSTMLHRKPSARPSAAHLSMHPYFSLITCGISHRYLRHLEASMNKLHDQRKKSPKGLVLIEVDSSTSTSSNNVSAASPIVSSLITSVANLGLEDLLKEIFYVPADQKPGGKSSHVSCKADILRSFWHQIVHEGFYFEVFNIDGMVHLLPHRRRRDPAPYRNLGTIILKCCIDRSKIPSPVALLAQKAVSWARGGLLTPANAKSSSAVLSETDKAVIEVWGQQLAALADGFCQYKIFDTLESLDFLTLASGSDSITKDMLKPCHEFYDFSRMSESPMLIRDYVNSLSLTQLRLLLLWATSQVDVRYPTVSPGAGFHDSPVALKWYNSRAQDVYTSFASASASASRSVRRIGFGMIELPEFEDSREVIRLMDSCLNNAGINLS